jgi:nucleotide-binding universal stress UspA family protein
MFSSIVVGTDGSSRSRQAVAIAAELAKLNGAKLHLVRAFRSSVHAAALSGDAMMAIAPSTDAEIQAQVEEELASLAAEIERDGVAVQTYACAQAAPSALLSIATHQDADLIVVGSKGMHGARRVLGSVPNSIAHQATCAVMIVPTG